MTYTLNKYNIRRGCYYYYYTREDVVTSFAHTESLSLSLLYILYYISVYYNKRTRVRIFVRVLYTHVERKHYSCTHTHTHTHVNAIIFKYKVHGAKDERAGEIIILRVAEAVLVIKQRRAALTKKAK